ncbi:MAG TPA: hypothetical protein PLY88_02835 [Candidatus Omnitrophota bacterium]|nr:hypothetical protein [Candidatus Omnitrophota bacterium]
MTETGRREQRIMDAPILTYEIPKLIAKIKSEEAWKSTDRNSITLNMGLGLRMVVIALHSGALIKPHKADHAISVQALEGELEFITDMEIVALKAGQMLSLHKGILHSVRARTECAFLITFGA